MDYRDLVFISVAQNMSISRAADSLHISQPAVSNHIKQLEIKYNTPLFDRVGNKIFLNSAGKLLYSNLCSIRQKYRDIDLEISNLLSTNKGELKIGASTTICQYVIPGELANFHKRYPSVHIQLINGNSFEIEKLLIDKKIDIALLENDSVHSGIKYTKYIKDNIVLVVSSKSIYAKSKELSIKEIQQIPLILREQGSGTLEVIERGLKSVNISINQMNIFMHLGATEAIKNFLPNFQGAALISEWAIKQEIADMRFSIINIKGLDLSRYFRIATLAGPELRLPSLFINHLTS